MNNKFQVGDLVKHEGKVGEVVAVGTSFSKGLLNGSSVVLIGGYYWDMPNDELEKVDINE